MSDQQAGWLASGLRVEWVGPADAPLRLNLTLSLGKHNPQTPEFWRALREVRRAVPGSVRVVVVRGDGLSFSSGLDTRVLTTILSTSLPDGADLRGYQAAFDWTSDPAFVSVAAVHGFALGAGLQLALACDLRIFTSDAVVGLPEVTHGLVPDLGATSRLVEILGYPRALELAATGRRLHGREAYELGLAQRLVEPEQLDAELERLVAELLAPGRDVVREIKALLLGAESRSRDEQRAAEREAQLRRFDDLGAGGTSTPAGAPRG